jgi:hypothetical protein
VTGRGTNLYSNFSRLFLCILNNDEHKKRGTLAVQGLTERLIQKDSKLQEEHCRRAGRREWEYRTGNEKGSW